MDSTGAVESIKASLCEVAQKMNVSIARDEHGRVVESGHVLTLRAKANDLEKTKAIIDAQWLAIQMAAFSGAAQVADDLDRQPPPSLWEELPLPSTTNSPLNEETKAGGETKPSGSEMRGCP